MKTPATPNDEAARIETLRSLAILDSPPEERFDRLTRMAQRVFRVPIALVSLVDENRQWFKSCLGLSVRETPRDVSFCGHAILGNDTLVIPDATADERFADNPLVVDDPHIRFYAGCLIRAPDGRKLGTLCIIDRQPRDLEQDDLEALQDLASMVERELAALHLATQDEVANILNRRAFTLLAQQSLRLCVRQGLSATLVFLDLDKFKPINDTFGHAEGDRALRAFADLLKSGCREADVSARIGGDEFALLLMNTPQAGAETVVAKLHASVRDYNRSAGRGYDIVFSDGIVEFVPGKHHGIEDLLAEGDALMYARKRSS